MSLFPADGALRSLHDYSKPIWVPPPPGRSHHHCNSIANAGTPRRLIYAYCTLPKGHEPETEHFDDGRDFLWVAPLLFWDEFERGRPIKAATKRKIRLCGKCGLKISSSGENDSCVCKVIGAGKRQGVMFLDERERTERDLQAAELQGDIDWVEMQWYRKELAEERIAIMEEEYAV